MILDKKVQELRPDICEIATSDQTYPVIADESLKSFSGATAITRWLLDSDFDRGGTLYVVGGGTVQDAACFVASILHRGTRWVFVPTTLLAQGDSCIGGKSSINVAGYKNQIGTFHPPSDIIIDESFLETLHPAEIRSGLGELLHFATLGGERVFNVYEDALTGGWKSLRPENLSKLSMHALEVKKAYVETDEFDVGLRRILNYGHTFGHGLEFASDGRIPHGIAVAHGIDMANAYAERRGLLGSGIRARIGRLVRDIVDPSDITSVVASTLFEGIAKDKKRVQDQVELVLIENLGRPVRAWVKLDEEFQRFLAEYLMLCGTYPNGV